MDEELLSAIIEFVENIDEILSSKYLYYEGVTEITNLKQKSTEVCGKNSGKG